MSKRYFKMSKSSHKDVKRCQKVLEKIQILKSSQKDQDFKKHPNETDSNMFHENFVCRRYKLE